MKSRALGAILFALYATFCICGQSYADGAFFADLQTHLYEPEQKAVILWDGRFESMILSARVQAGKLEDLSQLIWIIPLESADEPRVESGDINVFRDVIQFVKERERRISYGSAATVELKKIDIYDIAVLWADDAASLTGLISSLGYVIPQNASNLLQSCIESGMRYFVVNKINLANKYGKGFQEFEALTKLLADADSTVINNLMTRMPLGTAISVENAVNRVAAGDRRTTTAPRIGRNVYSGSEIMSLLNLIRRAAIMSLMAGVPYRDSILNTEIGEKLEFMTEDTYERVVDSCRLETDVYHKLQLYSGLGFMWDERLMRGRQWSPNYERVTYRPGYGPNVKLIVKDTGGQTQGINTVFNDGRMVIYFNRDLKERLAQYDISAKAYKKFLENNLYPVELKYKKAFDALNTDKLTYYARVLKEVTDVSRGIATPLKITFKPSKPLFPLRISALNQGTTKIDVYFCAAYPVEDINELLTVEKFKRLSHGNRKKLGSYFDRDAGVYLTRLSYAGRLSELSADALFNRSSDMPLVKEDVKSADEKAFEAIYSKKRPEEALIGAKIAEGRRQYGRDFYKWGRPGRPDEEGLKVLAEKEIQSLQVKVHQNQMAEMLQFVQKYPHSRFADDATTLLIVYAGNLDSPTSADLLYEMYKSACTSRIKIESFTWEEDPNLSGSIIGEYAHIGIVRLYLKTVLAGLFHEQGNGEMAAALAKQVTDALQPHLQEPGTEMYYACKPLHAQAQRLLPEKIKFDKYFDKGAEAYFNNRLDIAEKELKKAVDTPYGYLQSNTQTSDEMTNNTLVARFMLGLTRYKKADWLGARESFEKMLEAGAHFHAAFSRTVNGKDHYLLISPNMVKTHIIGCYVREGRLSMALEDGQQLLQTISDAPGNWNLIAMVHYHVACVYAIRGQKTKALAHLKECVNKEPAFKPYFVKDRYLKTLRDDPAFKNLVAGD